MGIDRLDRSWRLSAWGHRTTRAWSEVVQCEMFLPKTAVPVWFYRTTDERAKAHSVSDSKKV